MVAFMNERASNGAWTAVEIFVRTPTREVRVPIMQRQANIANGVR
jgi:hypothetical protein